MTDLSFAADMDSEKQRMALEAARAPHSWAWLLALPSGHLHNIKAREFEVMLAVRLGFEIERFQLKQGQVLCPCGHELTIDHGLGCASFVGQQVYKRHNKINSIVGQSLAGGEASWIRTEPRDYIGYRDKGGPDMSFRDRNEQLILTDVSVIASRSGINREQLMSQSLVLAHQREKDKRTQNNGWARRNSAKFIPVVFEARGGFGPAAVQLLKYAARGNRTFEVSMHPWEYNSHFQYYMKAVSVALIRGSAQNLLLAMQRSY
eukprot:m.147466 g.147466  ORF g.147466 m.147466 type:complete len:262 (-) comp16261_c0_seq3:45-830(-)